MKHNIIEKQYRKILYCLDFTINGRYFCKCYESIANNYCLRVYDTLNNNEELYLNWFDDSLSWDSSNEEYYTLEDIKDIINEAYRIIENYMF